MSIDAQMPAWKAEFLSKPSISVRKAIADNFGAPYEDTSTLVLTAPSGKFIDIRYPKVMLKDDSGRDKELIDQASFWAFSGISSTTFYDPHGEQPGFEYTAHTVFKHDIDSKGPGITDEGDCFLLPNGDAMEVGIWSHNGQMYKEVWSSPEPLPGLREVQKSPVIVAESIGEHADGRGIIIRIGDYIQALHERTNASDGRGRVLVRRITKTENGWTEDPRNSTFTDEEGMPCAKLTNGECDLNMKWTHSSGEWQITEYQA